MPNISTRARASEPTSNSWYSTPLSLKYFLAARHWGHAGVVYILTCFDIALPSSNEQGQIGPGRLLDVGGHTHDILYVIYQVLLLEAHDGRWIVAHEKTNTQFSGIGDHLRYALDVLGLHQPAHHPGAHPQEL